MTCLTGLYIVLYIVCVVFACKAWYDANFELNLISILLMCVFGWAYGGFLLLRLVCEWLWRMLTYDLTRLWWHD